MGKIKIGESEYLNKNCWLVKSLNYSPYKRCQYCELKFRKCLFLHYQVISLILIIFFLTLFSIAGNTSELVIISVFTLVIVYGYFFNKSTDKIIKANFAQRQANEKLKDLTQNLQQKVAEQTKDITQLSEMKSEFLRIVNHQLRTPTSILKSMLSMLVEGSITGKKKKEQAINKLYISSERLETILDDLLNAQNLVGQEIALKLEPIKIQEIINKIIKEFSTALKQKNLSLIFNKSKKELPIMLLDKNLIKTSFKKLIDNAIVYTKEGDITIDIKTSEKDIKISIKDTGVGISDENKPRLFKIFSRGKSAERIHPNGSGLGLYIVKEYIEAHQGTIQAQSEGENKGTEFIITLPIRM